MRALDIKQAFVRQVEKGVVPQKGFWKDVGGNRGAQNTACFMVWTKTVTFYMVVSLL